MKQLCGGGCFQQVARRARAQGVDRERVLLEHRQHQDRDVRTLPPDGPGGLNAVHAGKSDIHHNEGRTQETGQGDGLRTGRRDTYNLNRGVILQEPGEGVGDDTVIVDKQNAEGSHRLASYPPHLTLYYGTRDWGLGTGDW